MTKKNGNKATVVAETVEAGFINPIAVQLARLSLWIHTFVPGLPLSFLDHNIVYDYNYVLVVGKLDAIRKHVYDRAERPVPPRYVFERDRQGWHYVNARDTGWPIRGELEVRLDENDPQLIGPRTFWRAEEASRLVISAAFRTRESSAQIMWERHGERGFPKANRANFDVRPDGRYRAYEVDLASSPGYRGAITRLRLDPAPTGMKGDWVKIRSITLGRR